MSLLLLLGTPQGFVFDNFIDSDEVLLQNHTGAIGATWTKHPNAGTADGIITANRLRNTDTLDFSSEDAMYYASGVPPSAEYDITASVYVVSVNNSEVHLHGRLNPEANTRYGVSFDATTATLFKMVAGSYTPLGTYTYAAAWTAGQNHTIKIEIRDATKKVFIDGVERISSTDNEITTVGRAGLSVRNITGVTSGIHFESILATAAPVEAGDPAPSVDFSGNVAYLRVLSDVAPLYELDRLLGTTNNRATTSAHGTGGATTRRLDPLEPASTTVGTVVPPPGTAPSGVGWRVTVADMGAHPETVRTISGGSWTFIIPILASTAQVTPDTTITAILYHIGSTSSEIGRGTVSVAVTTSETTATVTISGVAAQTFDAAGETFQLEVYATAPGVAVVGQTLTYPLEWTTTQARVVTPDIIRTDARRKGGGNSTPFGGSATTFGGGYSILVSRTGGGNSTPIGGGTRTQEAIRRGGGISSPVGGGYKTVNINRLGGGSSTPIGGGRATTTANRRGGGSSQPVGGGMNKPLVNRAGGGVSSAIGGGRRTQEAIRRGGGISQPVGGGSKTALINRRGGGNSTPLGGGIRTTLLTRFGGGNTTPIGGGIRSTLISRTGGGISQPTGGGYRTILISRLGGGNSQPVGSGVFRLYSFGLSGYVFNATGTATVAGARVAVFRADTEVRVGVATSAADGYWAVSLTSDPILYWARSRVPGDPDVVDTTTDVPAESTLVQGPPV